MNEELTESFWVKIKEQTSTADFVVGVCYRLPEQEVDRRMRSSSDS